MSASPSSDRLPELAKYELLEELGHGGMATVYRARDPRLERDVAVKLIHKHLRDNADVRRRFVAEAKAVAKLRHPGIVDVYDVADEDDAERYIVVELIGGTTLRKILDEHVVFPPEVVAIVVHQLCDAVQHAHDAGVIHRDIKPENVLVEVTRVADGTEVLAANEARTSPRAITAVDASRATVSARRVRVRIKLTDFGIAKVLDTQGLTSTGQILGSPAHMAPEQIEGSNVGPHTDVFALGVLMYEAMVGRLPFYGNNPAQVLRRVLEGRYEAPDSERTEIGARWANIIAGALQHDIAARTKSAAELGAQITLELSELGFEEHPRWLEKYFANPEECRSELTAMLVPRLLARGEQEQLRGAVQAAASDLNRALALRPDDLVVLRRVGAFARARAVRAHFSRAFVAVVSALLLGAGAFGVTKFVRGSRATAPPRVAELGVVATVEPAPSGAPTDERRGGEVPAGPEPSSGRTAPTATALAGIGRAALDPRAGRVQRRVRFHATPEGARIQLNGAEITWFGQVHALTPGAYSVAGTMPPDVPCCESVTLSVAVTPPPKDRPEELQTIAVPLTIKPGGAVLVGAPTGSSMSCENGLIVSSGSAASVRMTRMEWAGTCVFSPGAAARRVTLRAGVVTKVPWQK
ncbi:MAG: serine/threonine protein kinase [Myxococcales bacterium]|nr:serine/threonine protein kinase [Myxococcales bacterium]